MSRHAGAYKSEKRKKEVKRQKKQEEKRLRRMGLLKSADDNETPGSEDSTERDAEDAAGNENTEVEGEREA